MSDRGLRFFVCILPSTIPTSTDFNASSGTSKGSVALSERQRLVVGSLRSESSSKFIICSRVSQQFHDFVNASFKHMRRGPSTRLQETYFGPVDGVTRQARRILGFGRGSWCTTKCLATKLATRRHATRLAISSEAIFVTWEQMFHSMLLRTTQ